MYNYYKPVFQSGAFNCPHCNTYSQQTWGNLTWNTDSEMGEVLEDWQSNLCQKCKKFSIWISKELFYPLGGNVPQPHKDMPEDIKADYIEASKIVNISPRGASALLRLCVEKLCKQLVGDSENINDAIKELVKAGLPELVQQALDSLRVIGNQAVHAGKMDLKDDVDTGYSLFHLLNYVVEDRITRNNLINDLYSSLPISIREAIDKRNNALV
ncbi:MULTISPECIES: DUF4145 domain-containing protein [Bacillales]|uniref:DUF4145 domain-containing protein n=1 Tax=Bacillales TaxID=1385 RepID=UPI0006A7A1F4|nr:MULTISPECIES: DUF4145 domain-containing protein [Bacillales]OBZ11131.1 hypothetical protein A7975_19365 [Bacillus sp. FJAT-26390]